MIRDRDIKNARARRSGVAVIIVLGMLALLMMMGVAFSVSMRIERRSAGNYSNNVGSKNLVWAALGRAISDIDYNMTQPALSLYPKWDVLYTSNDVTTVSLGRGEALDYIPGALFDATAQTISSWKTLGTASSTMGRYAYLIVNCSDFLDANYVGGSVRRGGLNPDELVLTKLLTDAELTILKSSRDKNIRFETLPELAALAPTVPADRLITYSRYPLGVLTDAGGPTQDVFTNAVYIGAPYADLQSDRPEIEAGFRQAATVSAADASYLFTALTDYLDPDSEPLDLNSPSTEAVPMINEVNIKTPTLNRAGPTTNCMFAAFVEIETFYPFITAASSSVFSVTGTVETVITRSVSGPVTSNMGFRVRSGYVAGDTGTKVPYGYRQAGGDVSDPASSALPTIKMLFNGATNDTFKVTVKVQNLKVLNDKGTAVDAVTGALTFNYPPTAAVGVTPLTPLPSYEAVDPRFNWDAATQFRQNMNGSASLLTTNSLTRTFLALRNDNAGRIETDTSMYVANRGHLLSVGELGHLVRSKNIANGAWQTIRLLEQTAGADKAPRDKVFMYFTVSSNQVQRGLVNLNSMDEVILETAFSGMPARYAESATPISDPDVTAIVNMILTWRRDLGSKNEFKNVDDMADLDWRGNATFAKRSDLELEAILAYSHGLLGTRNNLFTIIVAASPVSTGMGTYAGESKVIQAIADRRAVVQVWRDPFPDADGKHECFVQMFKWLGN